MTVLEAGDLNEVRKLLSSGADLNSPGRKSTLKGLLESQVPSYPLIWAAYENNLEAVQLLLDSGADPNICCKYVQECRICWLHPLCLTTHPVIVTMLLDAGADVNSRQRSLGGTETALIRSVYFRPSISKLLIDRGADVNMTDETGCTALYPAICLGRYELAVYLVQVRGWDILLKP